MDKTKTLQEYIRLSTQLEMMWREDITLPVKARLEEFHYSPDGPYIQALIVFEDASRGTLNTGRGITVRPTTDVVSIIPGERSGWVVELSKVVDAIWDPEAMAGRGEYIFAITGWRVERITRNGQDKSEVLAYGYGHAPDVKWLRRGELLPPELHEYVIRV